MIDIANLKTISINDEAQRTPLLCVTDSSVAFGKGVLDALKKPAYAKILVDENLGILVLFGVEEGEPDSFKFTKKQSDRYVRLKSLALHQLCNSLSGFTSIDYPYRVSGKLDVTSDNRSAVVFFMKEARKMTKK